MKKITNFLIKIGFALLTIGLTFIPTWIYLLTRTLFQPEGFWQELILMGLGLYFLMGIQLILIVVCFVILVKIFFND